MISDKARHTRSPLPHVNRTPDSGCALNQEFLTETRIAPSLQPVLVTDDRLKSNPSKMQTVSGFSNLSTNNKLMCLAFALSSPVIPVKHSALIFLSPLGSDTHLSEIHLPVKTVTEEKGEKEIMHENTLALLTSTTW